MYRWKSWNLLVVIAMALAFFMVSEPPLPAEAQTELGLMTKVTAQELTQPGRGNDSTLFVIAGVATDSTFSDTTENWTPATYTGVFLRAHGDSVNFRLYAMVGARGEHIKSDSVDVITAGTIIEQLNIPISQRGTFILKGLTNNGSTTTVDSLVLLTQW
jgi:hypothetical protein